MRLALLTVFATVGAVVTFESSSARHPFHITTAECEHNLETGLLEVSLKLDPGDLERVIRPRRGRPVNLHDPDHRWDIIQYLQKHFVVTDPDGRQARIRYVGKEVNVDWAYLYFEVPIRFGLHGTTIRNDFFFELQKDQLNTVLLAEGSFSTSFQLTVPNPAGTCRVPDEPRASNRLARMEALGKSYRAKLESPFLREVSWHYDRDIALAEARRKRRPLIVYATRSDHPPERDLYEGDFLVSSKWRRLSAEWVRLVEVIAGFPGDDRLGGFTFLDADGETIELRAMKTTKELSSALEAGAAASQASMAAP